MLSRRKATAVEGKDGFHFLANDTNRVLEQITGKVTLTRDRLDAIGSSHRERMELAEAVGAAYRYVIVPNKELVLARFLPTRTCSVHGDPRRCRPILPPARLNATAPYSSTRIT